MNIHEEKVSRYTIIHIISADAAKKAHWVLKLYRLFTIYDFGESGPLMFVYVDAPGQQFSVMLFFLG